MAENKIKVSIIGATGYVGAELVHGFVNHENVELVHLTSRSFKGQKFSDIYPQYRGVCDIECSDIEYEQVAKDSDLVITALPHGVSSVTVPLLLENGAKVIDHSGDFRYKNLQAYEKSYKLEHPHPELLSSAVYGLPEFYRDELKTANLVANPGCYPTCSLIALAPFLKQGLIDTDSIIIDAVSGVSGAGRKADLAYSFCETDEAFKPYGVVGHRHTSEIKEQCDFLSGTDTKVTFTPHLAPFKRGMLATIYVRPSEKLKSMDVSNEVINKIYSDFYAGEEFVRVLPLKTYPDVKAVNGSNYIEVNGCYDPETGLVKLFSAQDNLGKGAALQAIQAFNCMFGLPETAGLKNIIRGV
ncbi:MAG: N-acetyl-gamma-glutamyl-phosphate reductase [Clostridia bacterium]|nr:N-acetyl-gamma-glutamyl-phosphate reductase [Clostridia bacterium]